MMNDGIKEPEIQIEYEHTGYLDWRLERQFENESSL